MGDDDSSNIIKIHAAGSADGNVWDDKGRTNIVQIFVSHGSLGINSIQFQYAENGTLVLSNMHGSTRGPKFDVVKLNYPTEYITRISGHWNFKYRNQLTCIRIGTNQGEYGPFGKFKEKDKSFRIQLGDGQFGGFHGTADNRSVKSIGVYLKPNMTLDNKNKIKVKVKEEVGV